MKVKIKIKVPTASGNRKGWVKLVTSTNPGERLSKAFNGEFLETGEHLLEVGSVLAECYPVGSARSRDKIVTFAVVPPEGGVIAFPDKGIDPWSEAVSLVEEAEKLLLRRSEEKKEEPESPHNTLASFTDEEIRAEYGRRFGRIV